MRKHYLDNIRWVTILLVVIFHIFYYYNNIGISSLFVGAPEYVGNVTFAGMFQYFVYPWFMLLLFVVAGMSAKYSLVNKTSKQFLKARVDKLLVPSTLGILSFGWIGGLIIFLHNASVNMPADTPFIAKLVIILSSGTGALWFCHVLLIASLLLVLIRKITYKNDKLCLWFESKSKSNIFFVIISVCMYFVLWGGSHILNMPLITSYRNGIYIPAFLFGFYIFSNDTFIEKLKKLFIPLLVLAIASFAFYVYRCYGLPYSDVKVLSRWDINLYAFIMVLFVLSLFARFFDFTNKFCDYMKKSCFGVYVIHIPVMLVTNYFIEPLALPIAITYIIELVVALVASILLYELFRRTPIIRYWILGIKKAKK